MHFLTSLNNRLWRRLGTSAFPLCKKTTTNKQTKPFCCAPQSFSACVFVVQPRLSNPVWCHHHMCFPHFASVLVEMEHSVAWCKLPTCGCRCCWWMWCSYIHVIASYISASSHPKRHQWLRWPFTKIPVIVGLDVTEARFHFHCIILSPCKTMVPIAV